MAVGQRIVVDGHSFRTEREFQVYLGLQKMVKDGRVTELEVLPEYPLHIHENLVGTYQPTFRLVDQLEKTERYIHVVTGSNNLLRDFKIKVFEALYEAQVERWA